MSIFQQAAIGKVRFASSKGQLTVEQLYDLPVTSKSKDSLESIANQIGGELAKATETSFLGTRSTNTTLLELKMDLLKSVYATKVAMAAAKTNAKVNDTRRTELLAQKERNRVAKDGVMTDAQVDAELALLG